MGKIISSLSLRLLQRNVSGGAASGGGSNLQQPFITFELEVVLFH